MDRVDSTLRWLLSLSLAAFLLASGHPAGADCTDYRFTPRLVYRFDTYNPGYGILLDGTTAYWAGSATGAMPLRAFDISDPEHPIQLWEMPALMHPGSLALGNGWLYAGGYDYQAAQGAIQVIRLDDHSTVAFGHAGQDDPVRALAVHGDRVEYVTDGTIQIARVLPDSFEILGALALDGPLWDFAVDPPYAFVASREAGLHVVDTSDPAQPVRVATLDTADSVWDIALQGSLGFVAAGAEGLLVVDLADPLSPREVGRLEGIGRATGVVLDGSTAFVHAWNSMVVIDISIPTAPLRVNAFGVAEGTLDYVIRGDYVLVAHPGLDVFRHVDPAEVETIGSLSLPSPLSDSDLEGALDFLVGLNTLFIVDVSDRQHPVQLGQLDFEDPPYSDPEMACVRVEGSYAYLLAVGQFRIYVVDVSVPTSPVEVNQVWLPDLCPLSSLEIAGRLGYVAILCSYPGPRLGVLDLSVPTNPRLVATVPLPFTPDQVAYADSVGYATTGAYSGGWTTHLAIARLAPGPPEVLSDTPWGLHPPISIAVSGDRVYLSGRSYLATVDASDLTSPQLIATINAPLGQLTADGDRLYLAAGSLGVYAYDLSDRDHPALIGAWRTEGTAQVRTDGDVLVCLGSGVSIGPRACNAAAVPHPATVPPCVVATLPNPSAGGTQLRLSLGAPTAPRIEILDVTGRRIRSWTPGMMAAGVHEIAWDGRDRSGQAVAAGVYRALVHAGKERTSAPVIRLR